MAPRSWFVANISTMLTSICGERLWTTALRPAERFLHFDFDHSGAPCHDSSLPSWLHIPAFAGLASHTAETPPVPCRRSAVEYETLGQALEVRQGDKMGVV